MPPQSPLELKRALVREGFQIYRMAGSFVLLAERVRDNLIMDSGVAVGLAESSAEPPSEPLVVRAVLRAQASEFPSEDAAQLLERARQLSGPFEHRGYREADIQTHVVNDPGDPTRTIDTWYEVSWELPVTSLDAAVEELRFALAQPKAAGVALED